MDSVVVGDFYVVCILALPAETHAKLIVHSDTVLTGAITFERLELVPRRKSEFLKRGGGFKLGELAQGCFENGRWKFPWFFT